MSVEDFASQIQQLKQEIIHLREENAEYRRLASFPKFTPVPVFEFKPDGTPVYQNAAAQGLIDQYGLADSQPFLPDDLGEIYTAVTSRPEQENSTLQFSREVSIQGRLFQNTIIYSMEYGTFRLFANEITQRRQVEEELKAKTLELTQTQDFIEAVTKGNEVLIATIDTSYCYTYFNQAYKEEIMRLSGKDISPGMNMLDVFAHLPEQQKIIKQEWDEVLGGESTNKVLDFGDPGMYHRTYNVLHSPILDDQGKVAGAGEVAYNITEQIRMQEALKESEARFRLLLKNAPVTVAAQDKNLRFIWAYNQRTLDPTQVIGKTDTDLFPPEVAAWTTELKRKVLATGKELHEQGWIVSGGQRLYLDLFLEPIRDETGIITGVGIATVDLTGIKQAEEALRESESRYHALFEGMTEGFAFHELLYDEQGNPCDYRFLDINPAFEKLTGLNRERVVGKTYREILPQEGEKWLTLYAKVVLTGEDTHFEEYASSLDRYYEVFAYRTALNQFATIFLDITEHKKMENELRVNLTKYSVLFNTLPIGVTISDQDGQIVEANQEASRILGLSEEEQKRRMIGGAEWMIIRTDRSPMPAEEYASVRALKERRRVENIEMGILKDDGEISWISVTAAPIPLAKYGVVVAYNDISQRIQAQEALRQAYDRLEQLVEQRTQELRSINDELRIEIAAREDIEIELLKQSSFVEAERKRFNDVLEILPVYTILLTPDYHVSFANRYFREHFGEDRGQKCYEFLFQRDEPCINCETYKVMQTGTSHRWAWTGPDGRNYDIFDYPFKDFDGSDLIFELGIDITERKQAEEQLRSLNTYNRSLLEASLDALVTITPDGKIGDVNAVTEAITGYPRAHLIGTDFHSYFTDPQKARLGYEKVFDTGTVRDYELEIQHRDGHTTPVVYNASLFKDESGRVAGVFASARDITERIQAERQLVLLTTALESAANGIILVSKEGTILWANSAFSQMTGYAKEEVVGQNPRLLKSGLHDTEFYRDLWETILAGKVWHSEITNRRKDGSLYNEEQVITPVFDPSGEIMNFISIRQDITEHKQAEEALRMSEEQYRSLVIATAQIVWQTNAQGEVVDDIPTWRRFTGQSIDQLMGSGWINALHPDDRDRVAKVWAEAVETKSLYETEFRIQSHSGEYGDFSARGVPIIDKLGNVSSWIGTCTDITDKKNVENQLIQAEKHAVIGRMVGSVTHEINNPLQTIKNCLYLIQQDLSPDSTSKEPLEMAFSETQRLTNLVGQLRQLYRPQALQTMQPHELWRIIDEVHSLIVPHLNNARVEWKMKSRDELCLVNCVKDQMIEVFLNISLNAVEAMQNAQDRILFVSMVRSPDLTQVGVIIEDTGPGIDPEILPHIFEPFITTKDNGLGLGLSICYNIIQKHGGQITVDSQPGHGSSFTTWLPLLVE